jgi:calcium-dependent protein kinase
VEILKSLDHPNIVRAFETFDFRGRLYIVMEMCGGKDLYSRDPYTEAEAKRIMTSLLEAVAYLHAKGIVHRDLKFENIMFVDETPRAEIRLIDFGLSQKFAAGEHLHAFVGTVYTMAPELINGDYDAKADIWSLGVIAFMLLSSSMPFFGESRGAVIDHILHGKYKFQSKRWQHVSTEAKDFVMSLLRRRPEKRPSAQDALHTSAWLSQNADVNGSSTNVMAEMDRMDTIQASIQAFAKYPTLKKLALLVVAYKSTSDEIGFLRKMFSKFDTTNDGEISYDEFRTALLENYDYTESEMESMFAGMDIDGTGKVHYMEFLAATIEAHGSIDEERYVILPVRKTMNIFVLVFQIANACSSP